MAAASSPWKSWRGRFVLALVSLGVVGCGDGGAGTEERSVSGFIRDGATEAGVGGATVRFVGDTLYTAMATTDSDGFYELRVDTDSPFGQLQVSHPAYQPAEATVFFDSAERRLDLLLRRRTE